MVQEQTGAGICNGIGYTRKLTRALGFAINRRPQYTLVVYENYRDQVRPALAVECCESSDGPGVNKLRNGGFGKLQRGLLPGLVE